MSATFHPHTDGQKKAMNRMVLQFIYMYNHKHHIAWDESLPYIHHSYNRAHHSSTRKTPLELCYGFHPSTPINLVSQPISLIDTNHD